MRRVVTVVVLFLLVAPSAGAWTWPVPGPVLQPFVFDPSRPYAGGAHRGIDVGAAAGTAVVAPVAGTVTFAGTVPSSGTSLSILTADALSVTLTHLGSLAVAKGAAVTEGATVGTVGPSGAPELTVPYVHLGVRRSADDNAYLDPLGLLPALAPAAPPAPAPAPPAPGPGAAADPAPTAAPTSSAAPASPADPGPADPGPADPGPAAGRPPTPADTVPVTTAPVVAAPAVTGPVQAPPVEAPPAEAAAAPPPPAVETPAATPAPSVEAPAPLAAGPAPAPAASVAADQVAAAPPARPAPAGPGADPPAFDPAGPSVLVDPAAVVPAVQPSPLRRDVAVDPAGARPEGVRAAPPRLAVPRRAAAAPPEVVRPRLPVPARAAAATASLRRSLPQPAVSHRRGGPFASRVVGVAAIAAAALAVLLSVVRMLFVPSATREGASTAREDPRCAGVAVCERPAAHRPRGGLRRAGRRVRALPPAEGRRRPHGERHRRARHAGDGLGGPRGRIPA